MDVILSYHGRNTYTDVGAPYDYKGEVFAYVTLMLSTQAKHAPVALHLARVDHGQPEFNIWT